MTERTSTPQLKHQVLFSWNDLKQKSIQTEQPKEKRKPKIRYMKQRRLGNLEVSVHNRPGCRSFTLSQYIAEKVWNNGMWFMRAEYFNGAFVLTFRKEERDGYAKLSFNLQGRKPSATIARKAFVDDVCKFFGEGLGNYFIETSDFYAYDDRMELYCNQVTERQPIENTAQPKMKTCPKCNRTLPLSDFYVMVGRPDGHSSYCKDCNRQHGRLRNGTTGEYRADPTISQATDKQLYDELKRRGYDGKLTKTSTLE